MRKNIIIKGGKVMRKNIIIKGGKVMRKNTKWWVLAGIISAILLTMSVGAVAEEGAGVRPERLTIGTGSLGGTAYVMGTAIASLITEEFDDIAATAEPGSSLANISYVDKLEMHLAYAGPWVLERGARGDGYMEIYGKLTNTRMVLPGPPVAIYFLTLPDSGIKSLADIPKGGSISTGSIEATGEPVVKLLKTYGLEFGVDYKGFYMGHQTAVDALKDGHLDIAVPMGGIPAPAVVDAILSVNARVIEIEEDKLEQLRKENPYWGPITIPAATLSGQEKDILTLRSTDSLFTNKDMSEELIYSIVKLIVENADKLVKIHPSFKAYSYEELKKVIRPGDVMGVPWHPGAEKYLKERGIL